MKLTLDIILYFIRSLKPEIVCRSKKLNQFVGVKAFFSGMELTTQCLYIANLEELIQNRDILTDEMTFLAPKDAAVPEKMLKGLPCTLILVEECYKTLFIVNRIVDIFSQLQEWDKTMHISAMRGKSEQDLLDISETLLQYPMILFDATFEVIAYTKQKNVESTNFDRTVQNRYTDPALMARIRQADVFRRLKPNTPLIVQGIEEDNQITILLSFFSDQVLLGYGCVFCGKYYPEQGYMDLFQMFTDNICFCLEGNYRNSRFGKMMYETFLLNLMNSSVISEEQVSDQIKNVENITVTGRFVLCVIAFDEKKDVPLPFVARQLEREMDNMRPFIYEGQICLLKILKEGAPADLSISQNEMNRMDRLLENYRFWIGISNIFHKITELRFAFAQANEALLLKNPEDRYVHYSDVCKEHFLQIMAREFPLSLLHSELYDQVKAYDEAHKTEYLKIVLLYLECKCNAVHTAEKLFIHRNSVYNAVRFVEEHWKINITDPKIEQGFRISSLADSYLSHYGSEGSPDS